MRQRKINKITVKCFKCTEEKKRNILFELKDLPQLPPMLYGKFIKGECPNCGFKILIGIDD